MIDSAETMLHAILKRHVTLLRTTAVPPVTDGQISFQPPNGDWQTHLDSLGTRSALNVYLVDLRENRELRTNERRRRPDLTYEEPPPARVGCHYLVSAWSPAAEAVGKTLQEHALLAQVVRVLMARPLTAQEAFLGAPPTGFPTALLEGELPVEVVPPEGFPKLPEFWGTMGDGRPWRPTVYAIVTVPIVFDDEFAGPMVTTVRSEHRVGFAPNGAETLVGIGGFVRNPAGAAVGSAWVHLETAGGEVLARTESNDDGEFTFLRLTSGPYALRAGAAGVGGDFRTIDVPSPTGEYDLNLS